jgi:hypothetical protein
LKRDAQSLKSLAERCLPVVSKTPERYNSNERIAIGRRLGRKGH